MYSWQTPMLLVCESCEKPSQNESELKAIAERNLPTPPRTVDVESNLAFFVAKSWLLLSDAGAITAAWLSNSSLPRCKRENYIMVSLLASIIERKFFQNGRVHSQWFAEWWLFIIRTTSNERIKIPSRRALESVVFVPGWARGRFKIMW